MASVPSFGARISSTETPQPQEQERLAMHKLLGIGPTETLTHYRLLGIREGEDDVDVIFRAAERQIGNVRSSQMSSKFGNAVQAILNKLSTAQGVLLDADKKKVYDAQLQARNAMPARVEQTQQQIAAVLPDAIAPIALRTAPSQPSRASVQQVDFLQQYWKQLAAGGALAAAGVMGTVGWAVSSGAKKEAPKPVAKAPALTPKAAPAILTTQPVVAPKPTPAPAAIVTPPPASFLTPTPAPETAESDGWHSGLADIDLQKDVVAGNWTRDEQTKHLHVTPSTSARILLPWTITSEDFDIDMEFEIKDHEGEFGVSIMLPIGDGVTLMVGVWKDGITGLSDIDGVKFQDNPASVRGISVQKEYHVLSIHAASEKDAATVTLAIDGTEVYAWNGSAKALTQRSGWTIEKKGGFGFGANEADMTVEKIGIKVKNGQLIDKNGSTINPAPIRTATAAAGR